MVSRRAFRATLALVHCLAMAPVAASAADAFMTTGAATKRPIGHHRLCLEMPAECAKDETADLKPIALTPELILRIADINTRTNAEITPVSDRDLYGVEERWTYPVDRGDCEDYVLLKRRRLEDAGISPANLLITVVRKADGEGHAVLTLRTAEGDFVLDNLDWRIKNWRDTPYAYVKRQASGDPRSWVAIEPGLDVPVAALKK